MTDRQTLAEAWVRDLLENGGRLEFARLVEQVLDLGTLRSLARTRGLSPKGYRVDRAPRKRLLSLLIDTKNPEVLQSVCEAVLVELDDSERDREAGGSDAPVADVGAVLRLKEQELVRVRDELKRAREQLARQRDKESELDRRLLAEEEAVARLRSEVDSARRDAEKRDVAVIPAAATRRIHELERDLDALGDSEQGLRREHARKQARIRELEDRVTELSELVPKGRRKKVPPVEAPVLAETFRLPYLTPSFYKSLEGKERRAVEKAMQAVLLFCTEGPAYPGLEVKQIEGQDLWSLRASLKLRIYFQMRDDGDVEFVAVADREDQHTTLRRLKER